MLSRSSSHLTRRNNLRPPPSPSSAVRFRAQGKASSSAANLRFTEEPASYADISSKVVWSNPSPSFFNPTKLAKSPSTPKVIDSMQARYLTDLEWRVCHAVNIYVYRNGVENQSPMLVHIAPAKKANMKLVLQVLNERVKYAVGYAKSLYKMDGTRIRHPCELEMYNNYVVASNHDKHFKFVQYGRRRSPLMVLSPLSKHARAVRDQTEHLRCCLMKKGSSEDSLGYICPRASLEEITRCCKPEELFKGVPAPTSQPSRSRIPVKLAKSKSKTNPRRSTSPKTNESRQQVRQSFQPNPKASQEFHLQTPTPREFTVASATIHNKEFPFASENIFYDSSEFPRHLLRSQGFMPDYPDQKSEEKRLVPSSSRLPLTSQDNNNNNSPSFSDKIQKEIGVQTDTTQFPLGQPLENYRNFHNYDEGEETRIRRVQWSPTAEAIPPPTSFRTASPDSPSENESPPSYSIAFLPPPTPFADDDSTLAFLSSPRSIYRTLPLPPVKIERKEPAPPRVLTYPVEDFIFKNGKKSALRQKVVSSRKPTPVRHYRPSHQR